MKDCLDFFETPTNQRGLRVEASVGRHGPLTLTRWKKSSPIVAGIHGRDRQNQGRILKKIRESCMIYNRDLPVSRLDVVDLRLGGISWTSSLNDTE